MKGRDFVHNGPIRTATVELKRLSAFFRARVFSMDFSADNLTVIFPPPFQVAFSGNYSLTGREYLEYGTNRLISMEMHSNLITLFHQQNYTTSTNTYQQMELTSLVVP